MWRASHPFFATADHLRPRRSIDYCGAMQQASVRHLSNQPRPRSPQVAIDPVLASCGEAKLAGFSDRTDVFHGGLPLSKHSGKEATASDLSTHPVI